jgi:hypothetical protein
MFDFLRHIEQGDHSTNVPKEINGCFASPKGSPTHDSIPEALVTKVGSLRKNDKIIKTGGLRKLHPNVRLPCV